MSASTVCVLTHAAGVPVIVYFIDWQALAAINVMLKEFRKPNFVERVFGFTNFWISNTHETGARVWEL